MKKMVNDFRDFAKTPDANLAPLSVNALVMEILDLYQESQIRSELDPACPQVMADATQIHQVMMNLGTNALHAIGDAKGRIEFSLGSVSVDAGDTHTALPPGRYVHLVVSDTGVGIDRKSTRLNSSH